MGFLGREMGHGGESDPAFWYRESPKPLIGTQIPLEAMPANYGTMVNLLDPPWVTPGMLGMKLDPRAWAANCDGSAPFPNNLVLLKRRRTKPQWSRWFDEDVIGFDLNSLSSGYSGDTHRRMPLISRRRGRDSCLARMKKSTSKRHPFRDRPTWFRVMKSSEFETPNFDSVAGLRSQPRHWFWTVGY